MSESINGAPLRSDAQPQQRHVTSDQNRYRWEQEWMQQNRDASAVVGAGERVSLAGPGQSRVDTVSWSSALPMGGGNAMRGHTASVQLLAAPDSTAPVFNQEFSPHLNTSQTASAVPLTQPERLPETVAPSKAAAQRVSPAYYERGGAKSYGLWRSEDEVKLALRIDPEHADDKKLVASLRHWLAGAGLYLRTLIVNGQIRWSGGESKNNDGY